MMRFTTVEQALQWLQQPSGLTVRENRGELLTLLNDVRRLMFNFYEDQSTFIDGEECFTVQCYAETCNECDGTYFGFTLPADFINVEAAWKNRSPIKLHDRWRGWRDGLRAPDDCRLTVEEKGRRFVTERDPAPFCPFTLKFFAHEKSDTGKEVVVEGLGTGGVAERQAVSLRHGDYVALGEKLCEVIGVSLPVDIGGGVSVADQTGRVLSRYRPGETAPSYKRYQLTGVCEGDQVLVKGARAFMPVYWDDEIIETGNKLAIQDAAYYLRYNRSSDPNFIAKAASHLAQCKAHMRGETARETGKSTIQHFRIGGRKRAQRSGLRRKRYGYPSY